MSSRRIAVRRSGVHGKGVFATRRIASGEQLIEYKGERISWKEALRRHPHDPEQPNHTFYFALDDGTVIDGKVEGNSARWINHSCAPNCEAQEIDGRVFIHAIRAIEPDEELFYDYGLVIDARLTKKLKKEYECRCGAKKCRGTMLASSSPVSSGGRKPRATSEKPLATSGGAKLRNGSRQHRNSASAKKKR
ncbi:SET domain-containing protein-lysine N-methyltransferase [Mycetohabitans sp. B8]|uniref:SET domain-containing protein n=1 Tax=Mycetohabitans sp. B8 TaxID=2841845 RepID=UPI001F0225B7|nr:SET domain-containing protein-lysine N-methyltransferase [Mycetohabitans sp. B8]MCG1041173.1 SET domain-containing protein-lysine N-methyltransferase [Mycetohabitans sp. B8]